MTKAKQLDRSERTVLTEIEYILSRMDEWERLIYPEQNYSPGSIVARHFAPMCRADIDLDTFIHFMRDKAEETPAKETLGVPAPLYAPFYIAMAHLVKATRAYRAGNERLAWTHILDAERHIIHIEIWNFADDMQKLGREKLKKAHDAKHAEKRELKKQVQERYRAEKANAPDGFLNKDDAAIRYMKDFALEFTTIREHLKGL